MKTIKEGFYEVGPNGFAHIFNEAQWTHAFYKCISSPHSEDIAVIQLIKLSADILEGMGDIKVVLWIFKKIYLKTSFCSVSNTILKTSHLSSPSNLPGIRGRNM